MSPPTAVERLADTLVERLDLRPPIDILALAREFADVEEIEWAFNCDGLAVELNSKRPKIFLRQQSPTFRKRFTAAHEYGHIRISWHVDIVECHQDPTAPSSVAPEGSDRDLGRTLAERQEWEANRFASRLLIPQRFLHSITDGYREVPELLEELAAADVSASAGIIALSKHLPPGYTFRVPGLQRPYVSSRGTRAHVVEDEFGSLNPTYLDKTALAKGVVTHQGQMIEWWQTAQIATGTTAPDDSRSVAEVLRDALEPIYPVDQVASMSVKISAKTAGLLSHAPDLLRADDILTLLRYRLANDSLCADLIGTADFDLYLVMRAIQYAEKRRRDR
ncbi:ImmA/IrrE family metallo-endopeptidase [Kribbella sp. NPDC000426]|uniref:ImmA/IrrE family metallo-endopeptidase n=1 Tax=Kribbella sp. NPDC000426 TaxID=3154255 RepID=UPI00332551D5